MSTDAMPLPERLREALAGMVMLMETLRTRGPHVYPYVQSRGGQMVRVAEAIESARALLGEPMTEIEALRATWRTEG